MTHRCRHGAFRHDDCWECIISERDKLREFKAYVHKRLDDAGIPADPSPEENAKHGCRIEGRLNVVLAKLEGK